MYMYVTVYLFWPNTLSYINGELVESSYGISTKCDVI